MFVLDKEKIIPKFCKRFSHSENLLQNLGRKEIREVIVGNYRTVHRI